MGQNRVEYSLLEPLLMDSDTEQADLEFKPSCRRDHNGPLKVTKRIETCGRARLFVLIILAFLVLYVTIASSRVDLPQIIVRVPPDENEGNNCINHHPPTHLLSLCRPS